MKECTWYKTIGKPNEVICDGYVWMSWGFAETEAEPEFCPLCGCRLEAVENWGEE